MRNSKPIQSLCVLFACASCLSPLSSNAALTINSAQAITHRVTVQPIQVIQEAADGGAAATVFGSQRSTIESLIDQIWAQVGIDIEFNETINTHENSFAYNGENPDFYTGTVRPQGDLTTIVNSALVPPKSGDSSVLNMFFVDVVPGFSFTAENTANGLAFLDGNGVAMFVGDDLLNSANGREAIAKVVAHEIGHNLGLDHIVSASNLMEAAITGELLDAAQLAAILTDGAGADGFDLLVAVPEPHQWASLFGLLALAFGVVKRKAALKASVQ